MILDQNWNLSFSRHQKSLSQPNTAVAKISISIQSNKTSCSRNRGEGGWQAAGREACRQRGGRLASSGEGGQQGGRPAGSEGNWSVSRLVFTYQFFLFLINLRFLSVVGFSIRPASSRLQQSSLSSSFLCGHVLLLIAGSTHIRQKYSVWYQNYKRLKFWAITTASEKATPFVLTCYLQWSEGAVFFEDKILADITRWPHFFEELLPPLTWYLLFLVRLWVEQILYRSLFAHLCQNWVND